MGVEKIVSFGICHLGEGGNLIPSIRGESKNVTGVREGHKICH